MTRFIAGEPISESFALPNNTTGETFTITNATKPNGTSWAGPDITEIGSGAERMAQW